MAYRLRITLNNPGKPALKRTLIYGGTVFEVQDHFREPKPRGCPYKLSSPSLLANRKLSKSTRGALTACSRHHITPQSPNHASDEPVAYTSQDRARSDWTSAAGSTGIRMPRTWLTSREDIELWIAQSGMTFEKGYLDPTARRGCSILSAATSPDSCAGRSW